ncbi:hypothetical protein [Sandarakinorhabdus sp.]|uniref:hypothetical protein n=1 Tax=Sandarakinorhabdus sp. TaxID=1916663 RepID=UPI00286E5ED9|nr:hypothetical protein [Sandarakinorhabdus sp.]
MFTGGVILLIVSFFAMIAWFVWLAYRDPANLFKGRPSDVPVPETDTDTDTTKR